MTVTDPEVAAVEQIDSVGLALQVLRRTTGLRVALVARVTEDTWTACAIIDDAGLGLRPGDNLEISTTY